MSTVRARCLAATFAAVNGIASANAFRTREDGVRPDELPAIVQYAGGHSREESFAGHDEYAMTVEFDLAVAASASSALEPALDALYGRTIDALMADRTLGGVAVDLEEIALSDPQPNFDEPAQPMLGATLTISVRYWTFEGSATALAP